MEFVTYAVLTVAVLLAASVLTSLVAFRFGAPLLLIFLLVGLAAGEDGIGGIEFDDARTAFLIGSVALAVILFESGFTTSLQSFRVSAAPALALATVGVVLTSLVVAAAAVPLLDLSWGEAWLLGAIVASTDAAAVFFLLRAGGVTIRERVRSTLEIESGSNDPVAILLTIGLTTYLAAGQPTGGWVLAAQVLWQLGGGVLLGLAGGALMVAVLNRLEVEPGFYTIASLTFALIVFAGAAAAGASGFLAAYVAGLYAGNVRLRGARTLRRFHDGLTWLSQIVMFLTLGLLATPSEFPTILPAAVALAAVLVLLARPIAVWLCLAPFRYTRGETAFVAWVGLRGAVSILLAIVPMIAALPNGRLFFNLAFVMVFLSLLVQGWTVRPLARRLRLIVPPRAGPVERMELELPGGTEVELMVYRIHENSPVARGQRLPRWARPALIIRDGVVHSVHSVRELLPGDYVGLFALPARVPLLDKLFGGARPSIDEADRAFFGDLVLDPRTKLRTLAEMYGLPLSLQHGDLTLGELLRREFRDTPEPGDRLGMGPVDLIVRDVRDGEVAAVGLALEPAPRRPVPLFQRPAEIRAGLRNLRHRISFRRWKRRERKRS